MKVKRIVTLIACGFGAVALAFGASSVNQKTSVSVVDQLDESEMPQTYVKPTDPIDSRSEPESFGLEKREADVSESEDEASDFDVEIIDYADNSDEGESFEAISGSDYEAIVFDDIVDPEVVEECSAALPPDGAWIDDTSLEDIDPIPESIEILDPEYDFESAEAEPPIDEDTEIGSAIWFNPETKMYETSDGFSWSEDDFEVNDMSRGDEI